MKTTPQAKIFPSLFFCFLFFPAILYSCPLQKDSLPGHAEHLTILHLNDLHGQLEPFKANSGASVGGAARLAGLVKQIREENGRLGRHTLLLVAGDLFLGTAISAFFKGEAELKFINLLQPDAVTLGNHEFDFGRDMLHQRLAEARFPVVSANIYQGKERLFSPLLLKDLSGRLRVAIFGLITPDTLQLAHPNNIKGLTFSDPVAEAKELARNISQRSDICIALTHTGVEIDKRLARQIPGLDIIIGGHDHIALSEPIKIGDVWIGQAQNRGLYLGRVDLRIEGKKVVKLGGALIPITEELPEDKEVKEMVSSYRTKLERQLKEVVGKTNGRLVGEAEKIRSMETNLGNLVADVMRQSADSEIALVNGGSIRGSIEVGPITLEDVWRVFPYESRLVRLELTGRQIEQTLKYSVSLGPGLSGGFLQLSGLSFAIGASGPQDIRVQGKPLQPDRFYSVAITDFMFAGGDGYPTFQKGRNQFFPPALIRDLVTTYLKENKEISRVVEGRIRHQL